MYVEHSARSSGTKQTQKMATEIGEAGWNEEDVWLS